MTHHDNLESIGFILNQPTKVKLNDLMNDDLCLSDFCVFVGGPVGKNSIHYIHKTKIDIKFNLMFAAN